MQAQTAAERADLARDQLVELGALEPVQVAVEHEAAARDAVPAQERPSRSNVTPLGNRGGTWVRSWAWASEAARRSAAPVTGEP